MNDTANRAGRPRSESARSAILYAVDDLLVEEGYAAMTLKGIATRAGVSRQTIYRWWSTKAEVLFEASWTDAADELTTPQQETPLADIAGYLEALINFLVHSPAGIAYRALLGEAQHDQAVAQLLASKDVLGESAQTVIERALEQTASATTTQPQRDLSAQLLGPTFFWILSGRDPADLDPADLARHFFALIADDT